MEYEILELIFNPMDLLNAQPPVKLTSTSKEAS